MNQIEKDMMVSMINILNDASEKYYNSGEVIMSDEMFDQRLNDLKEFEEEVGFVMSNSPTQRVGTRVLNNLNKVKIEKPMLSLDKVHTTKEIIDFSDNKNLVAMIKCDGLSTRLIYKDGVLASANTRGTGFEGSDITDHVRQFLNVPLHIDLKDTLIVDGESIIKDDDFKIINKDNTFKNSRNTSAGTLSLLDMSIVKERRLSFIAWDVIDGINSDSFSEKLLKLNKLGFEVVPYEKYDFKTNADKLEKMVDFGNSFIFDKAKDVGICCDGVVWKYDSVSYGEKKGKTSHHFCNAVAYKKANEEVETTLKDIEWCLGKSGVLTPVAVFEPIELCGATVERASLHNISVMSDLWRSQWHSGLTLTICKANEIIPMVTSVRHEIDCCAKNLNPPKICPVCGGHTEIHSPNLICTNPNCKGKLLGKLKHFVSKSAMNINNLSEATLEKFIDEGFIESFIDIYELKNNFEYDIKQLDGFGEKSANKLFDAIEKSRLTTLDRFINALSIPMVGKETAKLIAKHCNYNIDTFLDKFCSTSYNWDDVDGIGYVARDNINDYAFENLNEIIELASYFTFENPYKTIGVDLTHNSNVYDKTFVITGSLNYYYNRDELKNKIEELGGKVSGSVSSKTDYLICNEVSNSSKCKKAIGLGVAVISENEFNDMINK